MTAWMHRGLVHSWVGKLIQIAEIRTQFWENSKMDFSSDCSSFTTEVKNMLTVWYVYIYKMKKC